MTGIKLTVAEGERVIDAGIILDPGDTFEAVDQDCADHLIACGVVEDPHGKRKPAAAAKDE